MAWSTLSNRALRTVLSQFGQSVTYRRGGVETTISKASYRRAYQTVDPNTGAPVMSSEPLLIVGAADLPGGEAREGDEVYVDGKWWKVGEPQPDADGISLRIGLHA